MPDTMHWAFVGDLQIPYHDPRAVTLWMDVMKWWRPKAIDFTGDIDDQLCYSSFSDGTTDEFFSIIKKAENDSPMPYVKEQAHEAKKFYEDVRGSHKKADLHSSLGNHDVRINKYIDKKAPGYLDQITPENMWGLDSLGISWRTYDDVPFQRYGDIYVHHGATTTTTGLAVKSDIESYNISLVRGHDHRGGVVYKTYPMTGRVLQGMGTGHMCNPKAYGLRYTINPSWELGFGIGHVYDNSQGIEEVKLDFVRITPDYTCVVDGKLFRG